MKVLAPGDRLGRYVVEALLGEGGMGEVYRAHDTSLKRPVAIKLVTLEGADTDEAKARLMREAQATAALSHDHVISIYDVGEHDGRPYIVMELLSGRTLRQLVGDPSIPLTARIGWIHDIAAALHAAHQKGIVHRDIKPENVFVRENGSIKVLDFGVARRFAPSESGEHTAMGTLTAKGDVVGTPHYMSPEQMNGEEIDGRSDQFAWGILAYELLSGRSPFDGRSSLEVVAAVLTREPDPLASLCPECPADVARVVMRALAKSRDARFESMQPIVEVLAPFAAKAPRVSVRNLGEVVAPDAPTVASHPSLVTGPTEIERAPRPRGKKWLAPAILIAATLAAIALAVGLRLKDAKGLPITSLPVPRSGNAEAERAYRAGLQGARDASGSTAREEFRRALALDPGMVAADVWLAQMMVLREPAKARDHLARAAKARSSLPARDADAVYVLEPLLLEDPGDAKRAIARLDEVLARRSNDAALQFLMAILRAFTGDGKGTIAAAKRAFELDPQYAAAWLAISWGDELLGDEASAVHDLERCIEVSSLASSCRVGLIQIHAQEGRCDRVVDETKRWLASSPGDSEALRARGEALVSRDLAWSPVTDQLLAESRKGLPDHERDVQAKLDTLSHDLFDGKLEDARTLARTIDGEMEGEPSLARHGRVSEAIVRSSLELGDPSGAADAAKKFLDREEIWVAPAQIWNDPTMDMLAVLRDTGRLSPADFARKRDAWVRSWQFRPTLRPPSETWVFASAGVASSESEARAAIGREPAAIPPMRTAAGELALAHVEKLAGDADKAFDRISRAAKSCHAATEPIAHVEAAVELGDALRARGDVAGACAAYDRVLAQWAAATTSKSFVRASEGKRAAGCH